MPILTFTTSGQIWTTIGKSKLYFPGAGVQSLLLRKERGEKRRSKRREDRKEKPEVGGTFLIMSPETVWFCKAKMIDWSLEGKEPMGLETWITKLLCILCVLMERSFGTKPGILVSHISNALICVAKACGWLPRDFVSSSTTWEAGKIGLQGPFSFAHSVNCSALLCAIGFDCCECEEEWRKGAGSGNQTGCSLEGRAYLLYCLCSSRTVPVLGLLTEALLPGFAGDRPLLHSFPCYHFNIKQVQTRRSDLPAKWEEGHLKVSLLCLESDWKAASEWHSSWSWSIGQCVHDFRLYFLGLTAYSVQHIQTQPVFSRLKHGEMKCWLLCYLQKGPLPSQSQDHTHKKNKHVSENYFKNH